MLKSAPHDMSGRPVRYYRYMPYKQFLRMVEVGRQTRRDFDAVDDMQDPKQSIYDICIRYLEHVDAEGEQKFVDYEEKIGTVEEALTVAFPEMSTALLQALKGKDYQFIRDVFRKHIPERQLHIAYGGGMARQFTPFVALSVGGPILSRIESERTGLEQVYVEAVIPTERMSFRDPNQDDYCEGEKEVFADELRLEDITSVVVSDSLLRDRFIDAEGSNVQQYAHSQGTLGSLYKEVEAWRWHTSIADYLPAAFIKTHSGRASS
ncbi:hypothetical protein A3C17_04610 [Candidatus Uhrbacteria bacterium RIFCSPHIGHO2_02_FULL_53_13]|uniref:Uncharacterized protein n=1 Tax=Candidatus Uhrbacteria bacterium RIFCSPHIGHO2_02_FULL_53_13 TaxID=1802389 RepID=A0A1F7U2Z6_9BACT|nr:MAG: hypothetical protein A3C17_04610 [Candidatus Uhrbacteria bacterium RIFCSPHIGHO2_02_FULL_53_13]